MRTLHVYCHGILAGILEEIPGEGYVFRYFDDYLKDPHHPAQVPITLRMLLTHTAALRDGAAYTAGIARGDGLSRILAGEPRVKPGWSKANKRSGRQAATKSRRKPPAHRARR